MSLSARRRPRGRSAGLLAFLLLATSVVVPTAIGVLSVEMTADLAIGDAALGLVVSAFWAVTALVAPLAGRWVDRTGWPLGARLGPLVTIACVAACVLLVDSWVALLAVVALSGVGYSLCSPTSNLLVMAVVPPRRQASVLGLKQTAPPLLMAATGAVLPALAHLHGWRVATAVVLILPVSVLLLTARFGRRSAEAGQAHAAPRAQVSPAERRRARRALVPMVVAAGLGTFSVATLTGFAVLTLVSTGLAPVPAAGIVSAGSLLAVLARVAAGRFLDARPPSDVTPLLGVMGAAGVALLLVAVGVFGLEGSTGGGPWRGLVVAGVVLSLVAAWTWPALLLLTVVRSSSASPGAASGLLQLGSGLGSAVGPAAFGVLSDAGGRGWAWTTMGVLTLVAMMLVRRPTS
jgi:predicted MFS family arabinose efflux permease